MSGYNQSRSSKGGGGYKNQNAGYSISDDDKKSIKNWIENGVSDQKQVKVAEKLGINIAGGRLTGTQFRNIFNEFRAIQTLAKQSNAQKALRGFLMLRPKLAYMQKRNGNKGADILRKALETGMEPIKTADDFTGKPSRYDHFMDFAEAVFAFHYSKAGDK